MKRKFICLLGVTCVLYATCRDAQAAQVSYHFSSTVSAFYPNASGFPASLSGVQVGDAFSGTISYSTTSPATTNPSGGVFALATYYALSSATTSINVDGVAFNTWTGTQSAFVWNNDATQPPSMTTYDGVLYVNFTAADQPRFKVGNLILSTSSFSNEALPTGNIPGIHIAELGLASGATWVQSGLITLTTIIIPPGDFDSDGDVDGADFVAWQTNFPKASGATAFQGDADGDGDVDGADFVVWQTHFPYTPGPGVIPVPEPGALLLGMIGSVLAIALRGRRRRTFANLSGRVTKSPDPA